LLVSGRTDHGPIRVKPNAKGASGAAAAALVIASPARKSVSRRRSYRLRRLGHTFKFDTARFESSQPSQPPGSLAAIPWHSENRRHFRTLAARSPVSGEGYRTSRAKRQEFEGES